MVQELKKRSKSSKEDIVNDNGVKDVKLGFKDLGTSKVQNLWFAPNPSKRWGELFFLLYSISWLTLCLGIIVPYRMYEKFEELEYLLLGLVSAIPSFLLPFLFVGKEDRCKNWYDRYWAKVPHFTFFMAHVCFLFYHAVSNITLRRLRNGISELPAYIQFSIEAVYILALSYFIAFLETFSIANFPYYEFVDRAAMYKVGSLFYALIFFVSFPMFIRLDEKTSDPWSFSKTTINALGAAMLVTILLDSWRLYLGPIVNIPESKECSYHGLPWFS